MERVNSRLLNWATDIDPGTVRQAEMTARLPIVHGHVALMSDAHLGIGATVGSVIPTRDAIIPSAVGVDIGCGMIANETSLTADDLPDNLTAFMPLVEQAVPAGVGQGNDKWDHSIDKWLAENRPRTELETELRTKTLKQLGSLGSGNHFVEVSLDERGVVWLVLHSGSRGVGNQLARRHMRKATAMAKKAQIALEDPALAYFMQGTDEFDHYIADMLWAQDYAAENRRVMMARLMASFFKWVGTGNLNQSINCHHNFTAREHHVVQGEGFDLWITRKGAIKAETGDLGVIPGSMGTRSYIVIGLGNPLSWTSCSHGAGRRMSRGQAKKQFTVTDLAEQMKGKVWLDKRASSLLDEIPSAYKDIDQVMADQADLVAIQHTLVQILNYKGT